MVLVGRFFRFRFRDFHLSSIGPITRIRQRPFKRFLVLIFVALLEIHISVTNEVTAAGISIAVSEFVFQLSNCRGEAFIPLDEQLNVPRFAFSFAPVCIDGVERLLQLETIC